MSRANIPNAVSTERVLSASPRKVFAAFEQPDQLAQWWGPKDFTNTFEQFDFNPGGRWVFVMHGPNGANYPNESVFREIQPDAKIVIQVRSSLGPAAAELGRYPEEMERRR
ncbi:SRPBCC domain-containing protein [Sorangium sp. So ce1078]|uniref:SRPBCC domain-containing protein n=1 Tax=Sorangium sp. So ce1078 TaxID=3133329 RepID=UPI003F61868A